MKIAELLKICICHEKDEWCVYVFNKIIGVTRYLLQNLTSINAQFLFFFYKTPGTPNGRCRQFSVRPARWHKRMAGHGENYSVSHD